MGSSLSTCRCSRDGCAAGYTLFLAVMAALGASLVLAREINYGVGVQGDSLQHINTAQTLLAGKGFLINATDTPYTEWPPLYPLALAAASGLSGIDPRGVAGPLNAALFGLTVFLTGRWLRRRLESRFLAAWAAAALALAVPLVDAASWVMSEPLFILLTVLALIHAEAFLGAGKRRSLVAAAACGVLAFQARYIGAAVPFFVGLLLLCRAGEGFPRRAKQAAAVWLAAGLPMAPWILRNYLLVGFFSGSRWEYDYPLPDVLRDIGATLWRWLSFELPWIGLQPPELLSLPSRPSYDFLKQSVGSLQPPELFSLAGGVWAAAAAAAAGYILFRFPWKKQTFASWRPLWVFGGFALIYIALFAAAAVLEYADNRVRPRYAAPAYIPLLTAAAFALDRLGRAGRGSRGSAGRRIASGLPAAAAMTALCLWTAGQAAPHARRIVRANAGRPVGEFDWGVKAAWVSRPQEQGGKGSGAPRPVESALLRYVREHPLDGVIYTNKRRMPLAIHNRRPAAYYRLPSGAERNALLYLGDAAAPAGAGQELMEARLAAAPAGAYWVRFKEGAYTDSLLGYGDAWLQSMPMLETVADLADGAIYRVRKNAPPRANPYRAALRAAVASRRVGGPGFDVSIRGGELVYIKESCTAEEARMRFMLHVYPADAADLPAVRKRGGYAFDNLSFYFTEHGVVLEGACVALYPLPDYAIERIETGQYAPGGEGLAWRAALRAAVGGSTSRRAAGR